jgi:hypothetical protein
MPHEFVTPLSRDRLLYTVREVTSMDMRAGLARVTAELTIAEADLRSVQERVDRLRTIREGLLLAVETYEKPLADTGGALDQLSVDVDPAQSAEKPTRQDLPGIPAPSTRRRAPSQTDLSLAALRVLGGPASTREIRDRIIAAGYKHKPEQIRSALTWLLTKERVERVAPGTWALPGEAPPQDDFTPAADTAGVSTAGENGHSSQSHTLARAGMPHGQ